MIVVLLALSLIVFVVWSAWRKHQIRKHYFQNVPGPKPVPIFGNTLDLMAGPKGNMSQYYAYSTLINIIQ